MTDLEALKAWLREVESSRPDIIGISTHWHRNPEGPEGPEGPEAADAIAMTTYRENLRDECRELLAKVERLEAENAKLREELAQIEVDVMEHYNDWMEHGCEPVEAARFAFDLGQYARAALAGDSHDRD